MLNCRTGGNTWTLQSILGRRDTAYRCSGIKCVLMLWFSRHCLSFTSAAVTWRWRVNLRVMSFGNIIPPSMWTCVCCVRKCSNTNCVVKCHMYVYVRIVYITNEPLDLKWCFIFFVPKPSEEKVRKVNQGNSESICFVTKYNLIDLCFLEIFEMRYSFITKIG